MTVARSGASACFLAEKLQLPGERDAGATAMRQENFRQCRGAVADDRKDDECRLAHQAVQLDPDRCVG